MNNETTYNDATIERVARAVCNYKGINPDMNLSIFDIGPSPAWEQEVPIIKVIMDALENNRAESVHS